MTEPFSQSAHDEAVEDFGRDLVFIVGLVLGIAVIFLFG